MLENAMALPRREPPPAPRDEAADALLCDYLNLRNMGWQEKAKEGDLLVNLVTAVLSAGSSQEAGVAAYRVIEEEFEILADEEVSE